MEFFLRFKSKWDMGCGNDEAARFEVLAHNCDEQLLRGVVQADAGFIEKPDDAGNKG